MDNKLDDDSKKSKQQQRPRISRRQSADSTATTSDCPSNKSKKEKKNYNAKAKQTNFVRTAMRWALSGFFLVGDLGLDSPFPFFFLFPNYYFYLISFICWVTVKSTFGLEITKGEREKQKQQLGLLACGYPYPPTSHHLSLVSCF